MDKVNVPNQARKGKPKSEPFRGCPTYLKATLWEASRQINRTNYRSAGRKVAGALPELLSANADRDDESGLDRLRALTDVRALADAGPMPFEMFVRFLLDEIPGVFKRVPTRRRRIFVEGMVAALDQEVSQELDCDVRVEL